VRLLRNSPSVVGWVAFNEGWGQFDAAAVAGELRRLDPDRLVDHASGWHDQRAGDVRSVHVYGRRSPRPRRRRGDARALVLSEYGGHQLRVPGHVQDEAVSVGYGEESTPTALAASFTRLHDELARTVPDGLAGTVYTQLSDVEDELNGLLTYDREVVKLDPAVVRSALGRLRSAAGT
jgi:hypothetical protein